MTATTADKSELLPCPFCGGAPYMTSDGRSHSIWMVGCSNCGIQFENYSLEGAKKEWSRRPTNEGQEGLTDSIVDRIIEDAGIPHRGEYSYALAQAIAHHLSSKQAARPGNTTMYDPNDVAFPKGFVPVDDVQDHTEQHLELVKADAVKMPVIVYRLTGPDGHTFHSESKVTAEWYYTHARHLCLPLVAEGSALNYATAHTAEAVRELVEGLRIVSASLRARGKDDLTLSNVDALQTTDALLAKYAPSQEDV